MRHGFEVEERKPIAKKIIREVIIWAIEIMLVLSVAYLITAYGVERTIMLGNSMMPTLQNRDKILINKMVYRFFEPERFDVVVFRQSGKEHSYYNIKRIIGLPGERIQIKDGNIYINGEELKEGMELEPMLNGGLAEEEIVLEEEEYFVLGDQRNDSEDSRFANMGNIVKTDIIGKAWIRLQPFDFISQIHEALPTESDQTSPLPVQE